MLEYSGTWALVCEQLEKLLHVVPPDTDTASKDVHLIPVSVSVKQVSLWYVCGPYSDTFIWKVNSKYDKTMQIDKTNKIFFKDIYTVPK